MSLSLLNVQLSFIMKGELIMKKAINTLQDALAFQLRGLFYAETKVMEEFNTCRRYLTSPRVTEEISRYIHSSEDKLLKLERIFNYLMQEPVTRKNEVIDRLLGETHHMLTFASTPHLKDILMIGCVQNINAYKISAYKTAYMFAVELELDTPADLLQQILEWELETGRALSIVAVEEFNKTAVEEKS